MTRRRRFSVSGRVRGLTRDGLTIFTDASCDGRSKRIGMGFIATSGHWGIRGHHHGYTEPGDSYVAELRAIAAAWEWVHPGHGRPVTIMTDSRAAVDYLNRWRGGDPTLPKGYRAAYRAGGGQPSLVVLADAVRAHPDVTFTWIKGHGGHPLQECADSLARIGYRAHLTAEEARTAGAAIALNRLADLDGGSG
jgi:ribonuclease HI